MRATVNNHSEIISMNPFNHLEQNKALQTALENPAIKRIAALYNSPTIKSLEKYFNNPAIKAASVFSSQLQKTIEGINDETKWRNVFNLIEQHNFQGINKLYNTIYAQHFRIFEEQRSIFEQINQQWTRFSAFDSFLDIGRRVESGLRKWRIDDILIDFYWCVFDDDLREKIDIHADYSKEEIDRLVIDYYSQNQYANIKKHINYWQENAIITNRLSLLNSAMCILEKKDDTDTYNVIIPLLLAQEDGLKTEIRQLIPDHVVKEIRNQHTISKLTEELLGNGVSSEEAHKEALKKVKSGKIQKISDVKLIAAYLGSLSINIARPNVYSGAKEILCRTFLSNWNDIEQLADKDKHNKFRDQILHGHPDALNYGTKKNLVHSWLELILLVEIYLLVKQIETTRGSKS